ncbi:MAG: AMP-binding protein [Myxococcota bacterium]
MSFLTTIFDNLRTKPERTKLIEVHATTLRGTDGTGMLDLIARARGALNETALRPGDRVAILAPNSVRWVCADLAAISAGGIIVPLYDRQEPRELAVMLRSARPTVLMAGTKELKASIEEAWTDRGDCQVLTFDELFEHDPVEVELHELAPEDTVAIIYTSGTSGEPKGVMLNRANIDFMLPKTADRIGGVAKPKDGPDRVFHFLPFCFAASRMMLWTQLSRPNPLMISTDLAKLAIEIGTAKPNYFLNVPAVLEKIRNGVGAKIKERGGIGLELYTRGIEGYKATVEGKANFLQKAALAVAEKAVFPKIREQIGPNLEFLISGSAPLSEDTQRWFQMLGIPVYQAYGLTETTGIVSLDEPHRTVPGRVGIPIDGVQTKLSEEGELLVKGPNIFAGYWEKDAETKRAISDGWFHTGDQVDIEDENLKIIGRIKNLLVPESGHNIAPEPIEEKFMEHCDGAEQAVVVGHARPFLSIIVTGKPTQAAIDHALGTINDDQPFYKRIKNSIVVDEVFTPENGLLTANQKLRRAVIEKHFSNEIDAVYEAFRAEKEEKARMEAAR